jgi:hypothetical protein
MGPFAYCVSAGYIRAAFAFARLLRRCAHLQFYDIKPTTNKNGVRSQSSYNHRASHVLQGKGEGRLVLLLLLSRRLADEF